MIDVPFFTGRYRVWLVVLVGVFSLTVLPAESASDNPSTLTLERAYELALENNERIQISRSDLKQAREDITQARSQILPSLSVEGVARRQKETSASFDANQENITGTARFTQPIYQGGKSWFGMEAARLGAKTEELRHFRFQQEVLLNVAQRFYGTLLARRQVELSENTLERSRNQIERARARYEVDEISRTPVLRAEVQVSEAREQLQQNENQFNVSLEELALELGIDSTPRNVRGEMDSEVELRDMNEYVEEANTHRRDYRQFATAVKQSLERVKVEKADWFPNLGVEATGNRYDKEIAGTREDWNVQAVLSYPIFSGWKEESDVDKAESRYRQAKRQLDRLRRQIRLDVREAYLNVETQRNVISTLENQVESARENYRQVSAQFEEGLVNSVDVSDAITVLNESELRLANARTQLKIDRLRLKLATGEFQQSRIEK